MSGFSRLARNGRRVGRPCSNARRCCAAVCQTACLTERQPAFFRAFPAREMLLFAHHPGNDRFGNWRNAMKKEQLESLRNQQGKMGYILMWALGVPIPVLLLIYFLRGCS
jgi:hypothetical protein